MIVGITAFVLILCNGIILGKPRAGRRDLARDRLLRRRCSRRSGWPSAATCARRSTPRAASRPALCGASRPERHPHGPDRNLALELVRTTEYAALAAARWIGRGEKESADGAAVDAMRLLLDTVHMDGIVVIGEGEKDEAPMLYNGERIGDGSPPEVDIAVDPLEGTELCAKGMPNAHRGDRAVRARLDVRPRARACTWRRSPRPRATPTCSTSSARSPRRSS